jgi:SAM-dependent methyltransferase
MVMLEARKEQIKSGYDRAAAGYARKWFHELDHKPLDRLLLNHFHALTENLGKVCDMGCGPGEVAHYLKERGADVMGIDLSEAMIREAKGLNPDIDFRVDDMFGLKLEDGSLAGIAAFYAIVNYGLGDIPLFAREFHRVLRKEGILFLAFHIGDEKVHVVDFFGHQVNLDFHYYDQDKIIDILERTGFDMVDVVIRYPYADVEPQTKRAYVFARK